MAEDETLLDKAVAMLPAVIAPTPKKKRKKSPTFHQRLEAVKKNLARLTTDVEKLAAGLMKDAKNAISPAKKAAPKRRASAKKRTTARKAPARKAPARKK